MKKKIYIAGPMTGLPESNYPAFNAAAAKLRALGHEVQNPAENPKRDSWADYMRLGVAQLVQCDCIVLLPGWSESKGALIERQLAQVLQMDVVHFLDDPFLRRGLQVLSNEDVAKAELERVKDFVRDWSAA